MQHYRWPGNIRELRNAIDRARLFADDGVIGLAHLPPEMLGREASDGAAAEGLAAGQDLRELATRFRARAGPWRASSA
jgi:transcriptional regulator of acetoin/glycerol metabolism